MNFCLLLLVGLVQQFAGTTSQRLVFNKLGPLSGYDLGASCHYDEDCVTDHTYCRNQHICQCRVGYEPGTDGSSCVATIGAPCKSRHDCAGLPHSDCRQEVCQCENNYIPDPVTNQCLGRVRDILGACSSDNQCQASFGDQSHCYNGRCECIMRFHFSNGRCFLTRGLNDFCSNSSECYIGSDYTSLVQCLDRRCQCIPGYTNQYSKCLRGAAGIVTPQFSLTLFVLFCIVTNFYVHNEINFSF